MLIGYARVSKEEQNFDLQHDSLRAVGFERIFDDKARGVWMERSGLDRALEQRCATATRWSYGGCTGWDDP